MSQNNILKMKIAFSYLHARMELDKGADKITRIRRYFCYNIQKIDCRRIAMNTLAGPWLKFLKNLKQ